MSGINAMAGCRGDLRALGARTPARRRRSTMERLEGRALLSTTFTVFNTGDLGPGSLRQAVTEANATPGADTIVFDPGVFNAPKTITLMTGQLTLTDPEATTITGPAAGVTISGNHAGRVFEVGSGAQALMSGLTIADGNVPGLEGGGIYNGVGAEVTLTDCTLAHNSALTGGGIYSDSNGRVTMTNCTLSGNSSTNSGGAFRNFAGIAQLFSCTISGNSSSSGAGGGLALTAATTFLVNTIVSQNQGGDLSGGFGGGGGGNNLIGGNALLAPLGDYGGPTQTMALLPGSPAIDMGTFTGAPATDQRGKPRVGISVDVGAFESQGFTLTPVAGSTPQSTPAGTAFANPLAVTVTANNAGEPVNGGLVSFAAPASGASATLSAATVTIAGGQASVTATANAVGGTYTVTASTAGAATPAHFTLTNVVYQVEPLFDQAKAHHGGSTIPIVIELTDGSGNNVGSSRLPVKAVSVTGPGGKLQSPGNSQPGNLFKFDPGTGTYQFNLKTTGFKAGTFTFNFTIGDDPALHSVTFVIGD